MTQNAFEKSIDQTRLDRLRGAILAAVSDFETEGYDSMEITRALLWASYYRAEREKNLSVWSSFMQFARDNAAQSLARDEEVKKKVSLEYVARQVN